MRTIREASITTLWRGCGWRGWGAQHTSVYPCESAATRTASLKSSVLSRTLAIAEGAAATAASSGQIHDALEPARCVLLWGASAGERQEEQTAGRRIDSGRPPAIQRVGRAATGEVGAWETGREDGSRFTVQHIRQLLSSGPRQCRRRGGPVPWGAGEERGGGFASGPSLQPVRVVSSIIYCWLI